MQWLMSGNTMEEVSTFREKWALMPKTWSNVAGLVLTPVRENLWAAERPFVWNSIDVGGKMAVIRLSDGTLWVHSPINLCEETKAAIDSLGTVKHIVSPNYEHVKYAQQWIEAYPDAVAYGCPGAKEKFPAIAFAEEVANQAPAAWKGEIESCWFDCEKNPFTGKPFFNEVNFLHVPSQTLISTDLYWNWPRNGIPSGTRAWKFGMDVVYRPFYLKAMAQKPRLARDAAKLLGWTFNAILPAHGRAVGAPGSFLSPELAVDDEEWSKCGGDLKKLLQSHLAL